MKITPVAFFFSIMLFVSCSSDSENEGKVEGEITQEVTEEMIEVEEPEFIELSEEEIQELQNALTDSLSSVFEELNKEYLRLKADFENEKESFYTFNHESFSVYHGETQIWYFDESFNLQFYDRDMGAEGGYMETEFRYFEKNKLALVQYVENEEMSRLTTTIASYLTNGIDLSEITQRQIYEAGSEYWIPDITKRTNEYEQFVEKISKGEYSLSDSKFQFEDSKMVESEYGGTESEGFSIQVDSLLFEYLYQR